MVSRNYLSSEKLVLSMSQWLTSPPISLSLLLPPTSEFPFEPIPISSTPFCPTRSTHSSLL